MSLKKTINAQPDGLERIMVNVKFFDTVKSKSGKEKQVMVHEVNTAFPAAMGEEEILDEINKIESLFIQERESSVAQKEVDEKSEGMNSKIESLNSNSTM